MTIDTINTIGAIQTVHTYDSFDIFDVFDAISAIDRIRRHGWSLFAECDVLLRIGSFSYNCVCERKQGVETPSEDFWYWIYVERCLFLNQITLNIWGKVSDECYKISQLDSTDNSDIGSKCFDCIDWKRDCKDKIYTERRCP